MINYIDLFCPIIINQLKHQILYPMKTLAGLIILMLISVGMSQLFKRDEEEIRNAFCANRQYTRPSIFTVTEPTIGVVRMGVETKRLEAAEALAANKVIVTSSTKAVLKLNANLKITTQGLTVQSHYEWIKNTKIFRGYYVTNNLVLKTTDRDQVGKLIDLAIKNGVTSIQSVSFEIDQENKKVNNEQLIELAVKDAQQRAERVLDSIGYYIVGVKSVQINADQNIPMYLQPQMMMADSVGMAAPSTQVFGGQKKQNQRVTIGYIIAKK